MTFLRMSLIGTGMILTVALLRLLLQRKVHRSVFLVLWVIAALRLLIPVFIPTGVQIALPQTDGGFAAAAVRTIVHPTQAQPAAISAVSGAAKLLPWAWLSVAVLLLLGFLLSHLRLRRSFRFSVPLPEEAEVTPNVRLLDGLASPLTYGVFRPTILLPAGFDWHDREKLEQILTHEKTHIRHRDVLVKGILLLTCCLHWFNPAVWLMFYLASQDMEMRCDAAVVRKLGKTGKLSYARTLVETEQVHALGGALQTGFSVNSTARRLKALAKAKVRPAMSVILGVITVVLACTGFLTVSAAAEKVELPQLMPSVKSEPQGSDVSRPPQQERPNAPAAAKTSTSPDAAPTEPTDFAEPPQATAPELYISEIPSIVSNGEWIYVTITGDPSARLVSDQPSVLAIQTYTDDLQGAVQYALCAYESGTANLYCDSGSGSTLVATVTVQPAAHGEEQKPLFLGEDYQPQIDFNPSDGPAGDLSWLLSGEETP